MPSWFWEQLDMFLSLAIPALLFCGVCAIIGSVGLLFRFGLGYVHQKRRKAAWLSWIYSAFITSLTFFALYKFQIDWKVWLGVFVLIVMGFFGYFLVPGHNDANHH
jgi:hypothetical protein